MAESMIERVARAIFEVEYPHGEGDEFRWERSRDIYFAQARAAIGAMREPTDAMVDALTSYDSNPESLYERAIDAALNEQVSG